MAQTITTMLDCSFNLATTYSVTVVDAGGSHSLTVPSGWYRTYLVDSTIGTGTQALPYSLIKKLQALFTATYWTIGLSSTGIVTVKSIGTGTSTVTFGSSLIPRMLGFSAADLGGSFTQNQTRTGTYQPYGCVFSFARVSDEDWQRNASQQVFQDMPDGTVYGWSDAYEQLTRKFTLKYLPSTTGSKAELSSPASIVYPAKADFIQPRTGTDFVQPFSLLHFLHMAPGRRVGVTFGDLQTIISGSTTAYDVGYLTPKTIASTNGLKRSIQNYPKLTDWNEAEITFRAEENKA